MEVLVMKKGTRGCGQRKTGGLYIFCSGVYAPCDRLPLPIPEACPCCGERITQFRSVKKVNPKTLFGNCTDIAHVCHPKCEACFPSEDAAFMWVGKQYYTVDSFISEAVLNGISKRIPFLPKGVKLGDPIYFAHPEVFPEYDENGNKRHREDRAGVFMVSRITAFHKILSEKDADDADIVKELIDQGITPVVEVDDPNAPECVKKEIRDPQTKFGDFKEEKEIIS